MKTIVGVALILVGAYGAMAVTARESGAKGDVVVLQDGAMDDGSATFRSSGASFTHGDVGKAIVVNGSGVNGSALATTIQAFVSPQQVTLAVQAKTRVAHALTFYGTDDTAAIRSCVYQGTARGGTCTINDGVTFLVSSTKSTIAPFAAGHNPIAQGTIDGQGKIIFAPQSPLAPGTNDRLFYLSSQETHPMQVAGAIAKGATSFTASDPADAAALSAGDWVIVTERDSAVKDNVYADWMEVSDVSNAVITTTKPFRMAFPNARPWGGPPSWWGLGFRKVGPITSNLTIRDITIIIPKIKGEHALIGIDSRDTRGTVISNIKCQDATGNCFAGYMDQRLTFRDNTIHNTTYSEFASEVDSTISGNQVNQPDTEVSLPGPPSGGGLEVDFGTSFSSVTENNIGPTRQVCLMLYSGIHDTVVTGNTCGTVTFGSASNCILCRGCYRVTISGNTCSGGTGNSRGIDVGDSSTTAPIYSEGNRIFNNRVKGFAVPLSCVGRRRADQCQQ